MSVNILLFILCFFISTAQNSEEQKKIRELKNLAENSKDNIIVLDKENYNYYVVQQPRPYIFALLFTAENMDCQPCKELKNELVSVSYSFHEFQRDQDQKVPIFFGMVVFSQETQFLFTQHKFQSVPHFFITFKDSLREEKQAYIVPKEDFIDQNMFGDVNSQKLLEFINQRTRSQVELRSSPFAILFYLIILICSITFLVFFAFKIKAVLLNPIVWFTVSSIIYIICTSGTIYNIIHNVPFAYQNPRNPKEIEYIARGQRSQYAGEGYLIGFLIWFSGATVIGFSYIDRLQNKKQQAVLAILFLVCFGMSFFWLISIYKVKASWYGPGFWPPDYYIRGSLMRDQGNSF